MTAGVKPSVRVLQVDHRDLDFSVRGGPPGGAFVARALSNEVSPNIGVGFARWEGAVFVGYYALYTAYLVLHSTAAPWLGALQQAMYSFVLPLTAITLLVIGARAWQRQR